MHYDNSDRTNSQCVALSFFQCEQLIDKGNEVPEQFTSAGVSFIVHHFLQDSAQMEGEPAKSENHY